MYTHIQNVCTENTDLEKKHSRTFFNTRVKRNTITSGIKICFSNSICYCLNFTAFYTSHRCICMYIHSTYRFVSNKKWVNLLKDYLNSFSGTTTTKRMLFPPRPPWERGAGGYEWSPNLKITHENQWRIDHLHSCFFLFLHLTAT